MKRRDLVLGVPALALATVPLTGHAQTPDRPRRIGFISLRSGPNEYDAAFKDALRDLGYVEGRTIEIDYQWAAESEARAAALAAGLVARKVDVIVAATTVAVRAAMRATSTIPIVMPVAADPIASGLVASLARPGGNVTGMTLLSTDTGMKRLQLLREAVPRIARVGLMLAERGASDDAAINARLAEQLWTAALQLGLTLTLKTIKNVDEIAGAYAALKREGAQALIVQTSSITLDNRAQMVALAAQHALPAMYETEAFVRAGGLLSYGPSITAMYRRAAAFVDKILKGAKPADLPVEQPSEFRLMINQKTAQALALTLPPTLLARADEVIE